MSFSKHLLFAGAVASLAIGCGDERPAPATPAAHPHAGDHAHDAAGGHAPTTTSAEGHDGPVVALGTAAAGSFAVTATRAQGAVEAGKDSPIYVVVVPAAPAKTSAVRFWIGTADAKGSVKAKAEVENAAEPNLWHTHAEVPDPLPADAKLWVEVEAEGGAKSTASFDLKR